MRDVTGGGRQSPSAVPNDWMVSTVDTPGRTRFENNVGKKIRRSGRLVARPTAKSATPGSTVDQIAIPNESPMMHL